ncbi:PleD family two-component system response regulator [Chloroflexota bacterium]
MPASILIVDDDPDMREALTIILESREYETISARDGIEALAKLKAERPDLMILDLLMPKMDGFEVLKELGKNEWSQYRETPIIILSSVREESSRRRYQLETSMEMGVEDYIEKPISHAILLKRVEALLNKKNQSNKSKGTGGNIKMAKKAKILLIDDDIDFINATKTVLESKPYEIIVAHDGDEGLMKAKTEKPDLILMDVIMPIKDGFTTAEQLEKDPVLGKIPIIMLTAYSETGGGSSIPLSAGLTLDTEDYISKPVAPEELLRRVAVHLKRGEV